MGTTSSGPPSTPKRANSRLAVPPVRRTGADTPLRSSLVADRDKINSEKMEAHFSAIPVFPNIDLEYERKSSNPCNVGEATKQHKSEPDRRQHDDNKTDTVTGSTALEGIQRIPWDELLAM